MVGIADLGEGGVEDENAVEATDVLVFMVSALTTVWTLPIGYFFVAALSGFCMEQLKQCCGFALDSVWIWIRIQHFRSMRIRIQIKVFMKKKIKTNCAVNFHRRHLNWLPNWYRVPT
jgi:hypothetical protein